MLPRWSLAATRNQRRRNGQGLHHCCKTYGDRITFTINPEIPYTSYKSDELTGKAKIWIKANNLIKYLDVNYDIEPLFEVDPLEVTIYWEADAATNKSCLNGLPTWEV